MFPHLWVFMEHTPFLFLQESSSLGRAPQFFNIVGEQPSLIQMLKIAFTFSAKFLSHILQCKSLLTWLPADQPWCVGCKSDVAEFSDSPLLSPF